nr:CTP synthase [Kibdelosporangium sp. MJ126-NF4]CEL22565.1 CTP synthase [Kibdelosporangium sp. MJ126-NF4]CTQ89421.1 CTP synthase (EC 6.3.4.2) [Kibdelosporangium sp. MJ126-NF4]
MTARLALVGDRSAAVRAHTRIPVLLEALADTMVLDAYWIPTEEVDDAIAGFDAIWLVPGSPYRSEAGALRAVRIAREHGIPFLGTCSGLQHALLEFARDVCGLDVYHGENDPDADELLIVPLTCSLFEHEGAVTVAPDSLAHRILGTSRTVERYHCAYGMSEQYVQTLREHGLLVTGTDDDGQPRIVELPGHPFFLATLFQPELAECEPHPVVRMFATAAQERAGRATVAG